MNEFQNEIIFFIVKIHKHNEKNYTEFPSDRNIKIFFFRRNIANLTPFGVKSFKIF